MSSPQRPDPALVQRTSVQPAARSQTPSSQSLQIIARAGLQGQHSGFGSVDDTTIALPEHPSTPMIRQQPAHLRTLRQPVLPADEHRNGKRSSRTRSASESAISAASNAALQTPQRSLMLDMGVVLPMFPRQSNVQREIIDVEAESASEAKASSAPLQPQPNPANAAALDILQTPQRQSLRIVGVQLPQVPEQSQPAAEAEARPAENGESQELAEHLSALAGLDSVFGARGSAPEEPDRSS
jgi:hypothetical protein